MKTKVLVTMFTLVFALAMMAQTATQAAPAAGDNTKACACCSGDKADGKTGDKCPMMKDGKMADGKSCCGDGCCKDGKCDMAAHKGHDMASGKSCCGDGKCSMAAHKDGKSCCGDKCPMMKGAKSAGKSDACCKSTAKVSCCAKGAACCRGGYMPCCGQDKTAA